jgi:hypothetical protein
MGTRRDFVIAAIGTAASLSSSSGRSLVLSKETDSDLLTAKTKGQQMQDRAEDPRITRARLSGPEQVTKNATVAELGADGTLTVLAKGTNEWVCVPGNENKIGEPPMCMNPMGMRWMMDAMQGKAKPTNESPGMIYMLCGATQRSNTDPSDKTSPAIPIGPHWMITWPFDAKENGLPTTVRDKGAWVMFAGTPWDGNEYNQGDKAVWTMSYARP